MTSTKGLLGGLLTQILLHHPVGQHFTASILLVGNVGELLPEKEASPNMPMAGRRRREKSAKLLVRLEKLNCPLHAERIIQKEVSSSALDKVVQKAIIGTHTHAHITPGLSGRRRPATRLTESRHSFLFLLCGVSPCQIDLRTPFRIESEPLIRKEPGTRSLKTKRYIAENETVNDCERRINDHTVL